MLLTPSSPTTKKEEARWVGSVRYRVKGETGYSAFELGGVHYRLGDTVLLKASEGWEQDFVARIESLWEDPTRQKHLEARWFYAPEHTRAGRLRRHHKREVFESTHVDDNTLDTVQGKCAVLSWNEYRVWAAQPTSADGAADEAESTFVCRGSYNTTTHDVRPLRSTADALADHALAELPLLVDPTDSTAEPDFDAEQPPLLATRRLHNPFEEARSCLLLNAPPARLPCREAEREKVLAWMRTAISEGGTTSPLYISGVPGTGKTATVREVCRLLRAEERAGQLPPFTCAEINGMRLPSPQHAYSLLWEVVSAQGGRPRQALAPAKALQALDAHFARPGGAKRRRPCCVVLIADEIDYLVTRNQGLLYNIFEWSSKAHAQLALVGISNTVDLPERLLPRLNSRLGLSRVPFLPYSHAELTQILRARLGSLAVFEGSGLELASRKVASVSGDVRRALEICKRATEIAEGRTARAASDEGAEAEPDDDDDGALAERSGSARAQNAETLSTPPQGRQQHGRGKAARGAQPSALAGEPRVLIDDIDKAARALQQAAPVRVLRRLSDLEQLLLCAALLETERVGKQDLAARAIVTRYTGLCRQNGREPMAEHEIRVAFSVLCDWRLLSPQQPSAGSMACSELDGVMRLSVQADDLRLALKANGVNAIARAVL